MKTKLQEFVASHGGVENFRFWMELPKNENFFVYDPNSATWAECMIEAATKDSLYSLEEGYKVNVVPVDKNKFVGRSFYQDDLMDYFNKDIAFVKEKDTEHVEHITGIIDILAPKAFVYMDSDIVVKE